MEARRERHRVSPLLLVLVAVVTAAGRCGAQVPVPARTVGFVYGGQAWAPAWGEAVVVEAFFDPLCPDSRDAWPPLQRAADHFGARRVAVVVHLFPLPYHSNAFIACRSIHAAHKLNASAVYPLLEKFFKYQEDYYNAPTYIKTRAAVVAEIANNLVTPIIGEANLAAYIAGFNDSRSDQAARISFKFGCARGVTGTPYYFVNGIPLNDLDFPLNYDKWISTLDPLVGKM
ncbi:uncharacterized protein LOC123424516 [Hordeum vulgare subsp. vulgare]|uniref:Thioredoxin-like fold domain-containing protein n=1 Tax=Hordeum vulgare subsp. vulgare TaxID=112509 RepID=A0A8I7B215_HORVV|nr:uncharacterized protein LOC123424516 [Hordeum vulgare subsp. vulgare]KAI4968109.1 hypothetical protein ZWY2020_005457 [Hordeum vulgare]